MEYHQDVDAQFIHMGHPLFDVAHFLTGIDTPLSRARFISVGFEAKKT